MQEQGKLSPWLWQAPLQQETVLPSPGGPLQLPCFDSTEQDHPSQRVHRHHIPGSWLEAKTESSRKHNHNQCDKGATAAAPKKHLYPIAICNYFYGDILYSISYDASS